MNNKDKQEKPNNRKNAGKSKSKDNQSNNPTKIDKKKSLIEYLKKSLGNITTACLNTDINRSTYYEWIKEDEGFKKQCEEVIPEETLDYVESKLFELIDGVTCIKYDKKGEETIYHRPPDNTSIIFYLKTKGKKRGYIEKSQVEHTIENKTDLDSLPIEDKKKILEIMKANEKE